MARTQINPSLITTTGSAAIVPSGTVMHFAGPTAPAGWTECDGSAVSRTTFATLFAAIGTTWGSGDGSTTFNVPDLRRRTMVGRGGSASGTLSNTLGSTGGEENHVLTVGELASHTHTVTDPGHNHGVNDPGHNHGVSDPGHSHSFSFQQDSGDGTARTRGSAGGLQGNFSTNGSGTGISINGNSTGVSVNSNSTGITIANNGSNTGHNTIQPSAVVIMIIKN